ncbi:MAG: hypothetical protein LBT26_07465 [Clostridiales Family XIII bacterium]|jgi:hypothetical protein|nr:hypothetical protein [Clostridiales Family XIII bacterium]
MVLLVFVSIMLAGCGGNAGDSNSSASQEPTLAESQTSDGARTSEPPEAPYESPSNAARDETESQTPDDAQASAPSEPSPNDAARDEFEHYLYAELIEAAELQELVENAYDAVSGDNYTDDLTLYMAIDEEIIPLSQIFVAVAEGVTTPKSKELREIHEMYISYATTQNAAFTMIKSLLLNQDYSQVTVANEKLAASRKDLRDFMAALDEYAEQVGVDFSAS